MPQINERFDVYIETPYREILARLGYNHVKTAVEDDQRRRIDAIIEEGVSICYNLAVWKIVPVSISDKTVILDNTISIVSSSFRDYIGNASYCIIMCGSAGSDISREVQSSLDRELTARAAVLDAVGGEVADAVVDWIQNFCMKSLTRLYGPVSKRRFSPGYGDFSLEYQKDAHAALHLSEYNIQINDRFFLKPEKSVIAFCKIG